MAFIKKPLKWTAVGQEPSELKKTEGFKMDESPAPGHFDFMFRSTYEAIEELQQKAGEVKTVNNEQPDSNGNVTITLPDVSKFYQKPTGGIPKTDLAKDTQTSLEKADSALQKVTKADVGLGNVDNTSDANKPVSTSQQAEFDKKAPIASPTFTGVPKTTTATAGTNTTQIATTAFVKVAVDNSATAINNNVATISQEIANHKVDNVLHDTYVACATTSATTEKVVTSSGFTLSEGARITVKFANANTTTTPTLKINAEVAKPLVKADGTAFKNIKAGVYSFVYSGTSFTVQGEGGEYGTATASDVLEGETFGTENGIVVGSMLDNGVKILSTSGADQNIEGFYAKGSKVKALELVPGDYLVFSKPSEKSVYATDAYKPISEIIKVNGIGGTIRIKYDIKTAGDFLGNSKVYVNGKAVGVTRNFTSSMYTTFTEDIKVNAGDALQIYAFSPSSIIYLRNFNIYNSFVLGSFS